MVLGKLLPQGAPPETKAYFESTPAFLKLFSDPTLQAVEHRGYDPSSTYNSFIGKTLSTEETIIAWQTFRKLSLPGSGQRAGVVYALSIGSGVNSHDDIGHGGFVSVLLDDVLGAAVEFERPEGTSAVTASLKANYKKPLRTPSKVLCRAAVAKKEGKKIRVEGAVEDEHGNVLATGEALFIITKEIMPLGKL